MATHEQLEDFEVWDPESGQSTTLAAGDDTDARTRAWREWHDGAEPSTPEEQYREYQNPWGQNSRHRRSNVQTPTPNACSAFRRRTVSPFDPTDFHASAIGRMSGREGR